MTAWQCPDDDCGGGFPKPAKSDGHYEYVCPWCGHPLAPGQDVSDDEIRELVEPPTLVARSTSNDDGDGRGMYGLFRGIFE